MSSKPLNHGDDGGFQFVQRALKGNATAAINFDRIQLHPKYGYIIFEYLKCEANQSVTPHSSHPNRYWEKNASKFLSLWRISHDLNAKLFLVNYAEPGTPHEDEICVIQVLGMTETGIVKQRLYKTTFEKFSEWFIKLNKECLGSKETLVSELYTSESAKELGTIILNPDNNQEPYYKKTIQSIFNKDVNFLLEYSKTNKCYAYAVKAYLDKRILPE